VRSPRERTSAVSQRRTGLFGGTFSPPHLGHVAALEAAWETGWFDRLLVAVAGDPYHKEVDGLAPAA
jgi:nicotinate-nucleotide adenylyltransferase